MGDYGTNRDEVDLTKYPTAKLLVEECAQFLQEVENLTPGVALEARLNRDYGPSSAFHKTVTSLIRQGINNDEGWCATIPISGPHYRRSKIALPCERTRYFSITTVYMDSSSSSADGVDLNGVLRGQYHQHPYGEINCVITMEDDSTAELMGMSGWQGAGWTSPGAGTHHYPETKGGALVALFFLPAGRISYEAKPEWPQPASL